MSEQTVKLGSIVNGMAERDAIHIAVAPVVAAEMLYPGQDVGITKDGLAAVITPCIGIVDPFLKRRVHPEEMFYLLLYPNTITSLRHEWVHPAFAIEAPKRADTSRSEQWLRDYADEQDLSYEDLLAVAKAYAEDGEYLSRGGRYEGVYVPDEFWDHYQAVTGEIVQNKGSFFSCAC